MTAASYQKVRSGRCSHVINAPSGTTDGRGGQLSSMTAAALLDRRGRPVSRGLSAHIECVEVQGRAFAVKRFDARQRSLWAREVASHLTCPQPEVIGIVAYGLDDRDTPWLATPWSDARQVRHWIKNDGPHLRAMAGAWVDLFQARLLVLGYRWYDATTRNLLLSAERVSTQWPKFQIVDYMLVPLCPQVAFADCLSGLEDIGPGQWSPIGRAAP